VDHFSQLQFVHLQIDDSTAETMLAKQAFEKFAAKHADNAWKQSCEASHQ
jgi:hypothetical protein